MAKTPSQSLWPLWLLFATWPFGVFFHNVVLSIVIITLAVRIYKAPERPRLGPILVPAVIYSALIAWMLFATLLNPDNTRTHLTRHILGAAGFIIAPLLLYAHVQKPPLQIWRESQKVVGIVTLLWGLVAVSQAIIGWRVKGLAIVSGPFRAYGFFSHPLSLAYSVMLLWPVALNWWMKDMRNKWSWCMVIGCGLIVWLSESRVIHACAGGLVLVNAVLLLRGRMRTLVLAAAVLGSGAIIALDKSIAKKVFGTLSGAHDRQAQEYPTDRAAFWHAHWEMFKQRPVLGHGVQLNGAYRAPYYERIGLEGFKKTYAAHNTFLQVAVEGGLIALSLYLLWIGWFARRLYVWGRHSFAGFTMWQTWLVFFIASLAQNSVQDAVVRFGLILFCLASYMGIARDAKT